MAITIIIASLIFVSLIVSTIVFPKIKIGKISLSSYWVIALLGAVLMIATLRVSFEEIGDSLFDQTSTMNPLKILCLFFSMTFISIFLEEAGFFKFLANIAVKKAKKSQLGLFVILYFLTAVLTVFTSNDIVILTFTPFICYFCKNAKINPLPYLIGEFAAANTWSMMLIIGNPTNMYLGANAGIDFIEFFKVMAIPTSVAGAVEFGLILLIFRKSLVQEMSPEHENIALKNKADVIVGLVHLGVCILLLALSNLLNFEMWLISLCVAASLLIYFVITRLVRKNFKTSGLEIAKSLPWTLIPFVLSMFAIVVSLNNNGVSDLLRKFLGTQNTIWTYGPTSLVAANLINNIPMSILYSTLPTMGGIEQIRVIYASIIGSNIGAFLTPIGALAGIMFTSLVKDHNIKLSFLDFSKYGILIAIPTCAVALAMLMLLY